MRVIPSKLLQCVFVSAYVATAVNAAVETCSTSFGSKSIKHVPSTTKTETTSVTHTSRVTAGNPSTTTVAAHTVSTTESSTQTFTTFTVIQPTKVITDYELTTTTKYKTTTAPPSTTTSFISLVSTVYTTFTSTYSAAGFTPVLDSLPGSYAKKRSYREIEKRARFPAKVFCSIVKTKTIVTTDSVTAPPKTVSKGTTTITRTRNIIVTETFTEEEPPPSTFVTKTSTVTATTTKTPVRTIAKYTTTSTTVGPTSTFYAACQTASSNNFAGAVNYYGSPAGIDSVRGPGTEEYTDDTNAQDCCISCFNLANCQVGAFNSPYADYPEACHLYVGSNNTGYSAGTANVYAPNAGYSIFNGPGGEYTSYYYE